MIFDAPVHCSYDNTCNAMQSSLLRLPAVTAQTRSLCDRFHYRTHACPVAFDADSYHSCENLATSGAKSVNNCFAASRARIRFLAGRNLIPFLIMKAVLINLRAVNSKRARRKDVENTEVNAYAR